MFFDGAKLDEYRQWAQKWVRKPDHAKAVIAAAELLCDIPKGREPVDPDRLQRALDAICVLLPMRSKVGWEGATWFWQLAAFHDAAAERLWKVFQEGDASSRLVIVQFIESALGRAAPRLPLQREVLLAGLRDPSKRVRLFAADRCSAIKDRDLLPSLAEAAEVELEEKVRRWMHTKHSRIDRGYSISEPLNPADPSSHPTIWVELPGCLVGSLAPPAIVEQLGWDEIAVRVRARVRDRSIKGGEHAPIPADRRHLGVWPMLDIREAEYHCGPWTPE
jgi:hypothetical protein